MAMSGSRLWAGGTFRQLWIFYSRAENRTHPGFRRDILVLKMLQAPAISDVSLDWFGGRSKCLEFANKGLGCNFLAICV